MKLRRQLVPRLLELVSFLTIARPHVVVNGFPADEGNVVEVARSLNSRYQGKIFWLVDEGNGWIAHPSLTRVVVLRKNSLSAMWRYVTAEAVFFTHGLFGNSRPQHGRTFINLWHGDGFKVKKDAERAKRSVFPAQYTVGCTKLLTLRRASDFRMPESGILHTGNPRMDQFYRPLSESTRKELGLREKENFIVWVPTFRSNHGAGATNGWSDVSSGAPNPNELMNVVATKLRELGFTLVVKPHPQDRESRSIPGTLVIDNEDLGTAGTTFYGLLGSSSGIITDYSSVWTEYLAMDRPIGFVIPDHKEYVATRGLYPPDLFEWLPGPTLEDEGGLEDFIAQMTNSRNTVGKVARRKASERLGLSHGSGQTTDNLLDALDAKGVFKRSGGLRKTNENIADDLVSIRRMQR